MDKLKSIFKITFLLSAVLFVFASCSDDDKEEPAPQPSRTISKVSIYKSTDKAELMTSLIFTYDNDNRLVRIDNTDPVGVVNYVYSDDNKISYNYSSINSTLVKVNTALENGRAYLCEFTGEESATVYSYDNGYLKASNNGKGLTLQYNWDNGNLKAIISSDTGNKYGATFTSTSVANDYSFDLNTLVQLINGNDEYVNIMNTYGQIAGILGNRSKNLIKDSRYIYDDSYDSKGRLKLLTIYTPNAEGYTFKIEYKDNNLDN